MEHLKTLETSYQWPLEKIDEIFEKRMKYHDGFPHVLTLCGTYSRLDYLEDCCSDILGLPHGECRNNRKCDMKFDIYDYCENSPLFKKYFNYRYKKKGKIDPILEKKYFDEHENDLHNNTEYFQSIHSHVGVWRHVFLVKTGYDYGFEDFCFKNLEDLVQFKLLVGDQF